MFLRTSPCWGISHVINPPLLIGRQLWHRWASTRPACSGWRRRSWARVARHRLSACSAAPAPTRPPPACRGLGRLERPPPSSDLASRPERRERDAERVSVFHNDSNCLHILNMDHKNPDMPVIIHFSNYVFRLSSVLFPKQPDQQCRRMMNH